MSIISEFEKIKHPHFLLVIFALLFSIAPGLMVVFLFHRDIFFNVDSLKLILLSIAITSPFIFYNSVCFALMSKSSKPKIAPLDKPSQSSDERFFADVAISSIATGTIFYIALLLKYVLPITIELKGFIIILLIIEISFLIGTLIRFSKS